MIITKPNLLEEPRILPGPENTVHANCFFVQSVVDGNEYSGHFETDTIFLHQDGKWRRSTENEKGEYTGYFETRQDAQNVLNTTL